MKSIDKRVRELRRAVEGTFNRYGLSLAVDELVLEILGRRADTPSSEALRNE